jgi:hypothetical protein
MEKWQPRERSGQGRSTHLVRPNCVFDASLVPETCLEFSPLPMCGPGIRFGKLRPLNDMVLRARR